MENELRGMPPLGSSAPTREAVIRSQGLPRYTNIVLGAWIALSGFVLGASFGLRIHDLVVGLAIVAIEVVGRRAPSVRFANVVVAGWLAFAILKVFEPSSAMRWNNFYVALLVLLAALLPSPDTPPRRREREANGSSRSRSGRPASSVRRNATRWRIPPESSYGGVRSNPQ